MLTNTACYTSDVFCGHSDSGVFISNQAGVLCIAPLINVRQISRLLVRVFIVWDTGSFCGADAIFIHPPIGNQYSGVSVKDLYE